jgi:lipopolysaccharide/colanic/teichoic acid biosynthesis glycosyltransferase
MRVLYLHQHFTTPAGSSGVRSYQFARALVARGHAVTMLCGSYGAGRSGIEEMPFQRGIRRGTVDGIAVVEFQVEYSNAMNFIRRTIQFSRYIMSSIRFGMKNDFDLIFATTTPLTVAVPALVLKLLKRKTFIFEVRDLWPELPVAMRVIKNKAVIAVMSLLEYLAYNYADGCIGLSPGIVEGITRRLQKPKEVVMIPNGCDADIFNPSARGELQISGINKGDFVALFSGAHGIANGLDAILNAAQELLRCGRSDIKILLVGDGKMKKGLQERAACEKITNCIFMDQIPKTSIARITASCNAGLMALANVPAFYYGTSPNKFFDYIASGIPVVNNYPGWLAELITQNNCGIAVPPDRPDLLAQALIRLADNPEECRTLGKNSLSLAKRFDRGILAGQFTDFIMLFAGNRIASHGLYACFAKRAMDFMLSLTGLMIISPVLVIITLLLVIANKGKPFFIQPRPGRNSKIFKLLKFKTMNDKRDLNNELMPDEQRLTVIGKLIRMASLDELLQLINVLKGDMSLVGPRPLLVEYLQHYSPEQARRHEVRPGITGWAQVNGRNTLSWQKKFEYDVWYVDHVSFLLDVKIYFLTIKNVLSRSGISPTGSIIMPKFKGNNEP